MQITDSIARASLEVNAAFPTKYAIHTLLIRHSRAGERTFFKSRVHGRVRRRNAREITAAPMLIYTDNTYSWYPIGPLAA